MHLCLCLPLFVVLGPFCAVFNFAHLEFLKIRRKKLVCLMLLAAFIMPFTKDRRKVCVNDKKGQYEKQRLSQEWK